MKWLTTNFWWLLFIVFVTIIFYPFILFGKLPIPADTIVGLYHPWRDALSAAYPNGFPYKNPLITDPVRQQYPYRVLAISSLKKGQFPVWNPYSFSGTPLLANIQSAVFYPLNIIFWIVENPIAWSLLIIVQPLLAGLFVYAYLRFFRISHISCFLTAVTFAFSGFMVAWLEWNTIGHTALWLPLILLAKEKLLDKTSWKWVLVLIFSESATLFAGHIQTSLYVVAFSSIYLLVRIWQLKKISKLKLFVVTGTTVLIITSIQLIPTANFILNSSREADLTDWRRDDWFIPLAHLVQFIAPDYFGNPATGNYWGVWNYGEFVGYAGIGSLLFAGLAIIVRKDKKTIFYFTALVVILVFALPTNIGKLPFLLQIPFYKTLQPSRLLFLVSFCLTVLAGLGLDMILYHLKSIPKKIIKRKFLLIVFLFLFLNASLWIVTYFYKANDKTELLFYRNIALRNLLLPTMISWLIVLSIAGVIYAKRILIRNLSICLLLLVVLFDVFRFTHKFTPFTDKSLLYPETKALKFIKENIGVFRIMTTDRRLLAPNVSMIYELQSIDGYDPLYLNNYAAIIAAWTRNKPDLKPAAFNRILTPEKVDSFFTDLFGVKYILSLNDISDTKYRLVFSEGQTKIYENTKVFPRVFLLSELQNLDSSQSVIEQMFNNKDNLQSIGFTSDSVQINSKPLDESDKAAIIDYSPNYIRIKVEAGVDRILVITDIDYDQWQVFVDGEIKNILTIDNLFRGVQVSQGIHEVVFRTKLW